MPKRAGNLFEQTISFNHLLEVYGRANISKNRKADKINFELNLVDNLYKIHKTLEKKNYKPLPYSHFMLRSHKPREIWAPQFQDVIIQHAIMDTVEPLFYKTLIEQTHGCRRGHGIHTASNYVQKCMRKCDDDSYYLQLDIRKYFYSINRDILRKLIEKVIKDKDLVNLMCTYSNIDGVDDGVPIGNLLSQFFGLIYLSPLDHFVKRELKQKYYCRYVDDFVIIGVTKQQAKELKIKIEEFLYNKLDLKLSKVKINKIKHGINFVGYRTWKFYKLVRKFSLLNFTRKVKKGKLLSVIAMFGHSRATNSLRSYLYTILKYNKSMIPNLPPKIIKFIQSVIPSLDKINRNKQIVNTKG